MPSGWLSSAMKLAPYLPMIFTLAACSSGPTNVVANDAAAPPDDTGAMVTNDAAAEAAPDTGTVNPLCANGYPAGPYGVGVGDILDPTLSWQGYAANDATVSTLTMKDLFDCDGSKGIDALIFDDSAGWCEACEAQAHDEASLTAQYDQLGIKANTLLIMDAAENDATTATALAWRMTYGLTDVGIYADPNFLLEPVNQMTIGLPLTMVVDPRTMKIAEIIEGYASAYPLAPNATAVSIATKNRQQ
jgi:hypothetical protein